MTLDEYTKLDATALAQCIRLGEITATEAAELSVRAIERVNMDLNAVIEVFEDRVEKTAANDGLLAGVPILNKDLSFSDAGRLQEMGSRLAEGYRPAFDSTSVKRLKSSGLNIIGRTTTPEFGNSGLTENLLTGVSRNPWDIACTPGGSSGGSAAIVAAGAVPIATAGDGGGSTRTPAALCGLVGLKATRGLIPVGPAKGEGGSGLTGPFAVTRTVRDCAALLDILAGFDPGDPYRIEAAPEGYGHALTAPNKTSLRIAFSTHNWAGPTPHQTNRSAVLDIVQLLASAGHHVEEATPQFSWDAFFDATVTVMCANLATGIDGLSRALERPVTPGLLQTSTEASYLHGKSICAVDLLTALGVFNDISRCFASFFNTYDVLVLPTNVQPAPRLEATYCCDPKPGIGAFEYQQSVYSNDHFLAPFNTTGQPSLTLPTSMSPDGMPIGVQLVSTMGEERTLLQLAQFLESETRWPDRRPICHAAA